ncbi:MAG: glycosyltransferase family 2 protein [Chloroflexi bacterium]|nr:glycosyltransferase family 2 protein [Chloroflexota bacterium]
MDLSIVIVNYNTRDQLRNALVSLYASQTTYRWEILVVDNASGDGSAEMVRETYPQVRLLPLAENLGFTGGNNTALRLLGFRDEPRKATLMPVAQDAEPGAAPPISGPPRYVLLLNPDTEVPPGALDHLIGWMDDRPDVGVVGPKLVLQSGSLDLACRRSFPTPEISFYRLFGLSKIFPKSRRFGKYNLTYLDPDEETEVDSVVGAFMFIRRAALEAAGILDEHFFMYGEDLDLCYRIKQLGWKIVYHPQVQVLHLKRESSRKSPQRTRQEFYRAMRIFYEKHYAQSTPLPLHWMVLGGIALRYRMVQLWS